jgi:hypothetical protein
MSGADKFDGSISRRAARNQGCELSDIRTLRKDPVGLFDHTVEGGIGIGEAAKNSVKMAHEQRRGQSLTGDVPTRKSKSPLQSMRSQ